MTSRRYVSYERSDRVARIVLDREERRNALSPELRRDLRLAVEQFRQDEEAAVAVLSGAGPTFCAGFDLSPDSQSTSSTVRDPWADRNRLAEWMDFAVELWRCPKPVIAQVHGHCLGGGVLLLLAADLVVASEECAIGWPRLPMGAGFMDGALALLIGQRRAKELAYVVGSRISGREAVDFGLANRAVPAAELADATATLAASITRSPTSVIQMRKAAITRTMSAAGYETALRAGAEWDALAHADPAVDRFRSLVREHGMNSVIDAFERASSPDDLGLSSDVSDSDG